MAPKCKTSDGGNLDMPKRSHEALSLSEMVGMYRKKHNTVCEVHCYPWLLASIGSLATYTLRVGGDCWTLILSIEMMYVKHLQ